MGTETITVESYYVGSYEDMPEKIFFNSDEAFASKFTYLDSFDESGNYVTSYELNEEGIYEIEGGC